MREAENHPQFETSITSNLDEAYNLAAQLSDDLYQILQGEPTRLDYNAALICTNLLDIISQVIKKPDVYIQEYSSMVAVKQGEEIVGLGFLTIAQKKYDDHITVNGQALAVPHVEMVVVVRPDKRNQGIGSELIRSRFQILLQSGIDQFLVRLSSESLPIYQAYHQKGIIADLQLDNADLKQYYVKLAH
jgi:GNAT superfamily N-acetyltransferase